MKKVKSCIKFFAGFNKSVLNLVNFIKVVANKSISTSCATDKTIF